MSNANRRQRAQVSRRGGRGKKKQMEEVGVLGVPRKVSKKTGKPHVNNRRIVHHDLQNAIAKLDYGSEGVDIRQPASVNVVDDDIDPNQDRSININPLITVTSLWSVLLPMYSIALSRGFQSRAYAAGIPSAVYYSFVYLEQLLAGAVLDASPMMTNVPRWLRLLYQGLRPTSQVFKTGEVSYKFLESGDDPTLATAPPPKIDLTDKSSFNFGVPVASSGVVNGYPIQLPSGGYTTELGEASATLLFEFFSERDQINKSPMWEMVPLTEQCATTHDGSAYAAVYSEVGSAALSPGGMTVEYFSECFIDKPLMAKFTAYDLTSQRVSGSSRIGGGGACYCGARVLELRQERGIASKAKPVFKTIDFFELVDVLAFTLAMAEEFAVADQSRSSVPTECPLTFQDFCILLRQVVMSYNIHAQAQAMDLDDFNGEGFYAFIPTSGGIGKDIASLVQLPLLLVENMRNLERKTAHDKKSKQTIFDVSPVWGFYANQNLPTNYTYTNGAAQIPLFRVAAGELPINLLDLSLPDGSPPVKTFIDANCTLLQSNVEIFNEYITSLKPYLMSLSTVGTEHGISALTAIAMTNHYTNFVPDSLDNGQPPAESGVTTPGKVLKRHPSKTKVLGKVEKKRMKTVKAITTAQGTSAYDTLNYISYTSSQRIVASAYNQIHQLYILPSNRTGSAQEFARNVTSMQVSNIEPYSKAICTVPTSTDFTLVESILVRDRHLAIASAMVKPALAGANQVEIILQEAALKGRGGIVGEMIGAFAKAAFTELPF